MGEKYKEERKEIIMRSQWKGFISGILTMVFIFALVGTAAARVGTQTAELEYNNIKVTLDGVQVNLVDVNGNSVEPFGISGTTYLPIRAISNAFGLDVDWDGESKTVVLTTPEEEKPENDGTTQQESRQVYITPTGGKYHYDGNCNGGTYIESTLDEALSLGLTPCKKCAGG